MRAIRLLAFLIFAGAAAFALPPSSPARAAPVAAGVLVPNASPEQTGLIQPAYWRRYYWHRHYWYRPYWHRRVWWRHRYYHRHYWRPHYYHRYYYHRYYWHPWHRRYWW